MKVAALLSGGKDSLYATWRAMESLEVACFITIRSANPESYMFHTPNIDLTRLQAAATGIPMVEWQTAGVEEIELSDLRDAIQAAVITYGISGVVTGAIQSVYQASRIQQICYDLNIWCFNPLWQCDQEIYMKHLIDSGFSVIIAGVFSAPFDESWLGREINSQCIDEVRGLSARWGISLTGEGGEYESMVIDAPFFSHRIRINCAETTYSNYNGRYLISEADLVKK